MGAPTTYPTTMTAPMTTYPGYGATTTLPTTASMVAYPQMGTQQGPFTFYPAGQAPSPAALYAPAGLNAPAGLSPTTKTPAKRDAKVAKKKKKGKKCGCC